MARRTRADLESQAVRMMGERDLYRAALAILISRDSVHPEIENCSQTFEDGGTYTARLYRARAAHGGIMVTTRLGDAHWFEVVYLDDMVAALQAQSWTPYRKAVMYLKWVRDNIACDRAATRERPADA